MSIQNDKGKENFGRRNFIKFAIVSGSVIAAGAILRLLDEKSLDTALAIPGEGPYYYGTDTSWAVDTKGYNASDFPQNFYIGRTGIGEIYYYDAFLPDAADKAGLWYTHTYWRVKGPYYKHRAGRTPRDYGRDQGLKAGSAWYEYDYWYLFGGMTFFADIEHDTDEDPNSEYFDGWHYYDIVNTEWNREVLEGFLDGIVERGNEYGYPFNFGIYTTPELWQLWFDGQYYDPQRPYVVWLADNGVCEFNCSPCDVCNTAKSEADSKFHDVKEVKLGNYKTIIWQFFTDDCSGPDCADYDIARQNGHIRFTPIKSTSYLPTIHKYMEQVEGTPSPYPPPPDSPPEMPPQNPYP